MYNVKFGDRYLTAGATWSRFRWRAARFATIPAGRLAALYATEGQRRAWARWQGVFVVPAHR